jgi:tRNA (guanine37-N1)-methyltransferase
VIRFDVVTLFPEMFAAITACGITRRALEAGLWRLQTWNPRDFTADAYRSVDDRPYGGGPGMVMLAEPLDRVLGAVAESGGGKVIYLSPQGPRLEHRKVLELAGVERLTLLCGRYEGVDERLLRCRVDEELSIGDFVLSGGEIAAMAVMDAVVRQLPGALGDERSAIEESFAEGLLDCPQYTRPERWGEDAVPTILLSGHHERIGRWRHQQALAATWRKRPELLAKRGLSRQEQQLLSDYWDERRRSAQDGSADRTLAIAERSDESHSDH